MLLLNVVTIYPDDKLRALWPEFKKIATREGKAASQLLREILEDYIKRKAAGNPNIPLDTWSKEPKAIAYPSSWVTWSPEDLQEYSTRELNQMRELLSRNLKLIDNAIEKNYQER